MAQNYGPVIVKSGLILSLDAADINSYPAPNIVAVQAYSVFAGGLRSSNYTVQYSDDNSTWTTAFTGVMSNNSSCGIITGTGIGNGSYGNHRYWRYVEGSAVVSHHPRVSRIDLIDVNGTIRNLITYTSDNCSDSGTYIIGTVSADLGSTTWYNTSNLSLNSSLINGVTYSSSNKGTLVLDGTDDTIFAPSINQLGAIPNPTWEIWVKSSGLGPGKSIGGLICPDYGQISYITGGGDIVYYLYNTDAGFPGTYVIYLVSSGVNCFDNNWHHIVCTRGYGIGAYIYVDGVVRASSGGGGLWSGSTIWSGMNTQIGNNPNDAYYNLLGNIAIAKIYNKYLTAAEVLQNYNATKGRFI
jgi:hypothetical protein